MTKTEIMIWGRQPVLEALRTGNVRSVLVSAGVKQSEVLEAIRSEARKAAVSLREVTAGEIERAAPGATTQGVLARVQIEFFHDVRDLMERVPAGEEPFLVILDQVQDPHNIGALLRTSDVAGVHGLIVPEHRSAPLGGTVAKVSAGAINHVPLAQVPNLARALDELRDAGVWLLGLDGEARQTIYDADLAAPTGLVVGSEGEGLRRLTRERCDLLVRLPMRGGVGSLNASVAGSIAIYEGVRQRLGRAARTKTPD